MNYIIKSIALIVWTVAIPFLCGMLPTAVLPKERRTPGMILLCGYLITFASLEIIGLPVLLLTKTGNFTWLTVIYTIFLLCSAMAGFVLTGGVSGVNWTDFLGGPLSPSAEEGTALTDGDSSAAAASKPGSKRSEKVFSIILWLIFLTLLICEFVMAYTHLFFDGDDAYYVVESVLSWQTDTMYRYLPYTGGSTSLDLRHAMALFPMWTAYLARITTMHPTAIAHSFLPMLMISLNDIALFRIASNLFEGKEFRARRRELLPMFMIAVSLLQIFGNTSIYTPETFLMMRSWQGKSVFVNFIIPCALLLFLRIIAVEPAGEKKVVRFYWLMLLLLSISSGLCSSMASILTMGYIFLAGILAAVCVKKRKVFFKSLVCCIPNAAYLALYAILKMAGAGF